MYSLGKSKELLWENFVSNIDVCTTCSLKWAYEMHHEIHSQLSIHFTLETTLCWRLAPVAGVAVQREINMWVTDYKNTKSSSIH